MKTQVIESIKQALEKMGVTTEVELTPAKGHGDFSTNIAMKLAGQLKKAPAVIARELIENIKADFIEKAEVAGPGFINIFVSNDTHSKTVEEIIKQGTDFGKGNQGKKINVEYVSANPTGHLHLGHARGAAIGSTLVNILRFAGNKVDSEYYINDAGNQIDILGISSFVRYLQFFGKDASLPEDSYRGQDIVEAAKYLANKFGDQYVNSDYEDVAEIFKTEAKLYLLEVIKEHLAKYGTVIDIYSSEQKLYEDNMVVKALEKLSNHTKQLDGALWLDTTSKGDDKDRVLVKQDGKYTYFAPDIAYHDIKISRGYDELINIWGADHIGYIKRMKIAIDYLGLPQEKVDILTVQLVKLFKDGQELKMSKRKGTSFTLEELIDEVGKDAARWFMVDRSINSEFVFDVNEATKKTSDNPVYTVQYSHARAHQLIQKATTEIKAGEYDEKEIELINTLTKFPEVVELVANSHKVNLLTKYIFELSKEFNSWYSNSKAVGNEREASMMALAQAVKITIANALNLLGIDAPNEM